MTRVLIALSEPIMVAGLQGIIDDADDFEVVGAHASAEGLRERATETSADVVVVDVVFRRADPTLVPELSTAARVLVLVDHSAEECSLRAALAEDGRAGLSDEALATLDECCLMSLRHSASGCLARGSTPDAVLRTLRTVAEGQIAAAPWLSALAASGPAGALGSGRGQGPRPVTARELEVMALVAEGLSNKAIARRLDLKEQTVKNHLAHMMEKLGLRSRLDVGMFALKYNVQLQHDGPTRPEE